MAANLFQAIHHPLSVAPGSGRLRQETDYEAYIKQLIRQVLLTAPGERINRPEFGAGVRRLVFAPLSPATASLAQTMIYQALTNWLSDLIRVEKVTAATTEPGRLDIIVAYLLRARGERRFLNVEVTV
ncbi:GPW/gp25 family protein [Sphingomonas sp. BIUV-7]|uniref:GPW/gp25 family protein n=1 Tax=Sphingomonas natans TaxID=3063330 RepID=A0ABT8YCQ4_9SPHN|nr:GPW/gp25 family protein [Sphingomonas sp. BIUV-7]MDO6416122.1 GPW/gp25 family protein [Sphingomonas sp. BIUV-7]